MRIFLPIVLFISFACASISPVQASKCYGEEECNACKNCNYCKHCNSTTEYCGVWYESRGVTPPWKQKPKAATKKKAA